MKKFWKNSWRGF